MITHSTTHWMSKTRFYSLWCWILKRCYNTKTSNYYLYWWRWISVCWRRLKFENFRDDMYDSYLEHCSLVWLKNTTIDRIDSNKNYHKENCRWATLKEQARSKRTSLLYKFQWRTRSLKERTDEFGMSYKRVYYRMRRFGWSFEKSLTTPIKKKFICNKYSPCSTNASEPETQART